MVEPPIGHLAAACQFNALKFNAVERSRHAPDRGDNKSRDAGPYGLSPLPHARLQPGICLRCSRTHFQSSAVA